MNAHLKNGRSYCTSNRVWHFVVVLFLPISGISVRFLLNVNVNANAFTYTHHNMIIDEMQYFIYIYVLHDMTCIIAVYIYVHTKYYMMHFKESIHYRYSTLG